MPKFILLFFLLLITTCQAVTWHDFPQPSGTLVKLWDITGPTPVEEVNHIIAQWDVNITPATFPFDTSVAVTEIIPNEKLHFVRVYDPTSGDGPNGPWLTRLSEVRGLTAQQIKDKFALPTLPTMIVHVELPPSPDPATGKEYALWTGIAAPIQGFGKGGGIQTRIIADSNGTNFFPDYIYIIGKRDHPQLINDDKEDLTMPFWSFAILVIFGLFVMFTFRTFKRHNRLAY